MLPLVKNDQGKLKIEVFDGSFDFSVVSLTWNMGQNNVQGFVKNPREIFDQAKDSDLIAICAQECKRKFKY